MHILPEKSSLFHVALGAEGRKDLKKKKLRYVGTCDVVFPRSINTVIKLFSFQPTDREADP
jgi:hypothetical protein